MLVDWISLEMLRKADSRYMSKAEPKIFHVRLWYGRVNKKRTRTNIGFFPKELVARSGIFIKMRRLRVENVWGKSWGEMKVLAWCILE